MPENETLPQIPTTDEYDYLIPKEQKFADEWADKLIADDKAKEDAIKAEATTTETTPVTETTTTPVAETTTVTTPEATTETVAETTTTEEPKAWYETDAPSTINTNGEVKPEEVVDYKALYEAQQQLLNDIEIKAVVEAKKAGKNLFGFVDEVRGNDPSKLATTDLFEIKLNQYNLTDEQKEVEREKFAEKSPLEQQESVFSIKQQLIQEQNSRLGQFASENAQRNAEIQAYQQQQQAVAVNTLTTKLAEITGKEYLGLNITPERAAKVADYVLTNATPNADGTYDIDNAIKLAMFMNFDKDIVKANVDKVRSQTVKEVHKEITRPSVQATTSTPSTGKTEQQEMDDAFAAEMADIRKRQQPIQI